jgi:nicotinamidase-related amidase
MKIKIISVDLQKEFSAKGGLHYKPRPSVTFVKEILLPYLKERKIKIAEIISDYRAPRPADRDDSTKPGKWGYESEIPEDVKLKPIWIKCMNSPIWTRKNIGVANKKPGIPYQDPQRFIKWLYKVVGKPNKVEIILIGLTADCCVFSTAQELNWQGYQVKILVEGVDSYSGNDKEKEQILNNYPLKNWANKIIWKELKEAL